MKKLSLSLLFIAGLLLMNFSIAMAQRGGMGRMNRMNAMNWNNMPGCVQNIPNLTEEQQNKISEIRLGHYKEMQDLRNQLMEKQVALNTITNQDNPDMSKASQLLEEISDLKLEFAQSRLKTQMSIRDLLTDEQKVYFNFRGGSGAGMGGFGPGFGGRGRFNCRGMGGGGMMWQQGYGW